MQIIYDEDGYGRIENLNPAQVKELHELAAPMVRMKFHNFAEEVGSRLHDSNSVTLHFYARGKSAMWKDALQKQIDHLCDLGHL